MIAFHEVRFPVGISFGSTGGPERRTQVVSYGSGFEERNQQWADSRRRYDAGYGIRRVDDLHAIIAFFEERRGRLIGFRWKDWTDWKSGPPQTEPTPFDQILGTGDGETMAFQLTKAYGESAASWIRTIAKPVANTVLIAVDGGVQAEGWMVDATTGFVTFNDPPAEGAILTAGFEFDVPVRFDTDRLDISLSYAEAGSIPRIPIIELRL